jgi:two-component system sensor histidine kinase/response regulator
LLLTDLHMPQMDGYELAVAIRQGEAGGRRMPIVALTANAVKGEADHCRALGMDDYMTKPVQLADLSAMLRKWMPVTNGGIPSGSAAAIPDAPSCALDLSVLENLVGDDPRVIAGFLNDFRLSAGEAAMEIRAACRAREPAAAGALAHKLKSSARSMGALALGEMCAKMEAAGSASRCDILDDLWPAFQSEMDSVEEFLSASHERC